MSLTTSGSKCYDSIETIPAYKCFKILTTGDLSHLVITGKPTEKELAAAWAKIDDEILEDLITQQHFIDQVDEMKADALEMVAAAGGDIAARFRIKAKGLQVEPVVKPDFYKNITLIEKYLGRNIDETTITQKKYMTYLKDLQNG